MLKAEAGIGTTSQPLQPLGQIRLDLLVSPWVLFKALEQQFGQLRPVQWRERERFLDHGYICQWHTI